MSINTEIKLIIFFEGKDGEVLFKQKKKKKKRPGADCDSDHELFITKFSPKLNKVGNTHTHTN